MAPLSVRGVLVFCAAAPMHVAVGALAAQGPADARPTDTRTQEPSPATLEDVFDVLERLQRAHARATPELRERVRAHERADAALTAFGRSQRARAVEEWVRLRLELEGATTETALLAACLRLEAFRDGGMTRRLRGFYSNGGFGAEVAFRVRALAPIPELAGHTLASDRVWVEFQDPLTPSWGPEDPRRANVRLAFDAKGCLTPVTCDVQFGPTGNWDSAVQLCVDGTSVDAVWVENELRDAEQRRLALLRRAGLDAKGAWSKEEPRADSADGDGVERESRRRCFVSRVELVTASADSERSAEFLARWNALPPDVLHDEWYAPLARTLPLEAEALRTLERTDDPLTAASRNGPVWRTFALDASRDIAAWVRLPLRTVTSDRGTVVALQPEGFDEGWFLRLAGGGALFALGPAAGFRVVALDGRALADDPAQLAAALQALERELAGGPVYVIAAGGAIPFARRAATAFPERIAGVAALPRGSGGAPVRVLGLEAELREALAAWTK